MPVQPVYTARMIIKAKSTALDKTMPIGTITPYMFEGDVPKGWLLADGRVFTKEEFPELHKVVGHSFVLRCQDSWLQRLVRRLFKLAGPEKGLRANEGRLPDCRSPRIVK